jgi:hypothetical protein
MTADDRGLAAHGADGLRTGALRVLELHLMDIVNRSRPLNQAEGLAILADVETALATPAPSAEPPDGLLREALDEMSFFFVGLLIGQDRLKDIAVAEIRRVRDALLAATPQPAEPLYLACGCLDGTHDNSMAAIHERHPEIVMPPDDGLAHFYAAQPAEPVALDVEALARAFHTVDHPAIPDCRMGSADGLRYCEIKAARLAAEYAKEVGRV